MILLSFTLALLAIYAGMTLMALTKRETLGMFYSLVSWFILIAGFAVIICAGVRTCRHCRMMCGKQECRVDSNQCKMQPGCCMHGGHRPDSVHIPPRFHSAGIILAPDPPSDSVHIPPGSGPKMMGAIVSKGYVKGLTPAQLNELVSSKYFQGIMVTSDIFADSVHIPPHPKITQIDWFLNSN